MNSRSFLRIALHILAAAIILAAAAAAQDPAAPIKVGIIGLDAHALAWTQIINGPGVKAPVSGMRIVAAYPSFSADVPFSADNIQANITKVGGLGVEITGSIEEMLSKVDAVMILSIDGRPHPEQARAVFKARKPLFVDKPVAASLVETIEVFREAQESGTPCFSSSALRYGPIVAGMSGDPKIGRILGCDTYCNNKPLLPGHPDLFYYGIHGCEMLFTIMGSGCRSVTRLKTETADLASGLWGDGRLGTFRGILQGRVGFGATVFGEKGIVVVDKFEGYEPLLAQIVKFFQTGKAPVTVEQTLEIYAFMEAADESLRQGGKPVTLESVLAKARLEAETRRGKQ